MARLHKYLYAETLYEIRCPFCGHEFRTYLKPGACIADCPAWSCGKTIILKGRYRDDI